MCGCSGGVANSPPGGGSSVDGSSGVQGVLAGMLAGLLGLCVGIGKVLHSGPIVVLGLTEGAGTAARAGVGCICGLLPRLVWVRGVEFGAGGFSSIAGHCGGARILGLGGADRIGVHGDGEVLWVGPLLCGSASVLPRVAVLAHR